MKELEIHEIQECCLKMLDYFDKFAKENDLTYFLSGGTLLGAIRHKGFIPWDDDVDLMMPRPDYEKMLRVFKNDEYFLSSCEMDKEYCSCHARLWDTNTILEWEIIRKKEKKIGCFIDIFPIDGYPTNKVVTKLHLLRARLERIKISTVVRGGYSKAERFVIIKKILTLIFRKSGNYYANSLVKLAKKYDYTSSKFVGVYGAAILHLFKEKNPKSVYSKTIMLDFENLKLPGPIGYDKYLKQLYGDYMKLPPEEKRVSDHGFHIYWRKK